MFAIFFKIGGMLVFYFFVFVYYFYLLLYLLILVSVFTILKFDKQTSHSFLQSTIGIFTVQVAPPCLEFEINIEYDNFFNWD